MNAIEKLSEILQEETNFQRTLLDLVKVKRQAIMSADLDQLYELTQQEDQYIEKTRIAESERKQVMLDLSKEYDFDPKVVKLKDIIEVVDANYGEKLSKQRMDLIGLVKEIKEHNQGNLELLGFSIDHMNSFFEVLSKAGGTTTYERNGSCNEKKISKVVDRTA